MGLLTILKKIKQKEKEIRVLILGLDNAGKTTIVKKFNGEDIDEICPTLGFNIKTFEYKGYTLNCWDVGGQATIRSYWRNYFEETDGLVWVVDSADRARLADCKAELHGLLQQEIAEALDLKSEAFAKRHWHIVPCSAVTGAGLVAGMDWMVEDVGQRIFMSD